MLTNCNFSKQISNRNIRFLCSAANSYTNNAHRFTILNSKTDACENQVEKQISNRNIRFLCSAANSYTNNAHRFAILNSTPDACENQVEKVKKALKEDLFLYDNFISEGEHDELMKEINKSFRRSKYQYDHWDGAICGFRESEKSRWSPANEPIINRMKNVAFGDETNVLPGIHILDLAKDGYISAHVDSVKFTGTTITGLNLLSSAVMRFIYNGDKNIVIDLMLPWLSLYVMKDCIRYDFTHEVLADEFSYWNNKHVPRDRRVSFLMRDEPA